MEFGDLLIPALLAFWVYCVFDVIRTPEGTTENLPKIVWLLVVVFLNFIGGLAWLLLGRPRRGDHAPRLNIRTMGRRDPAPSNTPSTPPAPPVNDDDYRRKRDEAIRRYNEQREVELRRREAEMERRARELRQRDQGEPG